MPISPEQNPEIYRGTTEEAAKAEKLRPQPPFYLIHDPGEWELGEVDGAAVWLPSLSILWEVPGVNAVRGTRRGADSSMARIKIEEQGRTVLPQSLGYVKRLPARGGTWHHCLVWDHTKQVGNKTLQSHDAEGYNAWRLDLVTKGIIAPPDPDILQIHVERMQDRVRRHVSRANVPGVKAKLDRDQAKLDAATQAIDAIRNPSKPKRKRASQ